MRNKLGNTVWPGRDGTTVYDQLTAKACEITGCPENGSHDQRFHIACTDLTSRLHVCVSHGNNRPGCDGDRQVTQEHHAREQRIALVAPSLPEEV